jgi:hypothetical protein
MYNASATQLAAANNLHDSEPASGDRLVVPAAYHESIPALRTPRPAGKARTLTASRKAPVKAHATATVSAKRPVHPAAGTLAQLSHNRSLNR